MSAAQSSVWNPQARLRRSLLRAVGWRLKSRARPSFLQAEASILVIRPDHLGDLLLSYPAVGLLRHGLPRARLSYLVGPWGEEAARRGPALDQVLICPFPGFTRQPKPSAWQPYQLLLAEAARLRGRFDAAVVLRPDHWWGALLAAVAGIPVRVGFAEPACAPLLTHTVPWSGWGPADGMALDVARRTLALSPEGVRYEEAGTEQFSVRPDEAAYADAILSDLGVDRGRPLVALHPGAGARLKLWSADRWAQVGAALVKRGGAQVVVTGSPDERSLAEGVASGIGLGAACAAGRTSLGQLAAVLARASLAIGPDCGPLHLAAAVGTPTLRVFGPTDPLQFMPTRKAGQHALAAELPCRPCGYLQRPPCGAVQDPACLAGIDVKRVVEQALLALGSAGPEPAGRAGRPARAGTDVRPTSCHGGSRAAVHDDAAPPSLEQESPE